MRGLSPNLFNYGKWEEEGLVPGEARASAGRTAFYAHGLGRGTAAPATDFSYWVITIEELARHGTNTLFTLHSDIVVPYINSFGNSSQKEKWLPGCVSVSV